MRRAHGRRVDVRVAPFQPLSDLRGAPARLLILQSDNQLLELRRKPIGLLPLCTPICLNRKKINLSTVLAGQKVGVKQVDDRLWLASFMTYDLGYFDEDACRLEPIENPFAAKVLPMCPE